MPVLEAACILASLAVLLLAYVLGRPRVPASAHWTRRARDYWTGGSLIQLAANACFGALGVGIAIADSPFEPEEPLLHMAVTGTVIYVLARRLGLAHARRHIAWLRNRPVRQTLLPRPDLAAAGLGLFLLPEDLGPAFAAVLAACLVLFGLAAAGGGLAIARRLGAFRPAPDGVDAIVRRLAEEADLPPPVTLVAPLASANAFAIPTLGTVVLTERALEVLDEIELREVLAHELGHLAEPASRFLRRYLGWPLLFVVATANPILAHAGPYALGAALAGAWGLRLLGRRESRVLEVAADAWVHGRSGGHDEAAYARSLMKLCRENLVPPVTGQRNLTHPDLYDRLLAAGIPPDYERPEPPDTAPERRVAILFAVAAAVFALLLGMPS